MVISLIVVGLMGLFFGIFLTIIYLKFKVEENPLYNQIYSLLPKANCGGCGFAGCSGFAESLIEGKVTPDKCVLIEANSLEEICNILGILKKEKVRKIAKVCCYGGINAKKKFEYKGIKTCFALSTIFDSNFECIYGCVGYGDCIKVCPVKAIEMGENEIPIISSEKCIGCGKCVEICPKKIIKLIPKEKEIYIACSSNDRGALVIKICQSGCIGCGRCVKICPKNAIIIENNLAIIDYEKCDFCKKCVEECPRKIIFTSELSLLHA
ncbi:MAG: RnfABCDGE type electron transport complex subunit B [bacterium]|nr:RnfABCDGE type electron transport complex subunit B [bacterium]